MGRNHDNQELFHTFNSDNPNPYDPETEELMFPRGKSKTKNQCEIDRLFSPLKKI